MNVTSMEIMDNTLVFRIQEDLNLKKNQPKKITLAAFGPWIHEQCGATYKITRERVECVADISHIEPGCFAALYTMRADEGLEVFELCDHYRREADAWEALENLAEAYLPVIFEEWVGQQYITDRGATVERLEI